MCHTVLDSPSFFQLLFNIDRDLARLLQAGGCRECGSALHYSNFPRKPKGISRTDPRWNDYQRRLSFCCSNRECRKRHTPLSVRFFARRHYLAFVVTLAAALMQGLQASAEQRLCAAGIPKQTLHRWMQWWRDTFVTTPAWQQLKAYFVGKQVVPKEPLESIAGSSLGDRLVAWLKQLCAD